MDVSRGVKRSAPQNRSVQRNPTHDAVSVNLAPDSVMFQNVTLRLSWFSRRRRRRCLISTRWPQCGWIRMGTKIIGSRSCLLGFSVSVSPSTLLCLLFFSSLSDLCSSPFNRISMSGEPYFWYSSQYSYSTSFSTDSVCGGSGGQYSWYSS